MGILDSLLGGGQQQQDFQGFVNRYEQGQPSEGYSDAEVLNRYQQVAPQLPQGSYMQAAEAAFARMSPQQRAEFGQFVQQQAQQQGINIPGLDQGNTQNRMQDPGFLAQMVGGLHQQSPGLLPQLLGMGMGALSGGMGGSGAGGASGASGGGILANPAAKAALAGIAAMAVKQFMGNRQL